MPRYLIERNFSEGLAIPMNDDGRRAVGGVIANNAEHGVTWVHSYVSPDRKQTFCIYDAPAPRPSARWLTATICRSAVSPR